MKNIKTKEIHHQWDNSGSWKHNGGIWRDNGVVRRDIGDVWRNHDSVGLDYYGVRRDYGDVSRDYGSRRHDILVRRLTTSLGIKRLVTFKLKPVKASWDVCSIKLLSSLNSNRPATANKMVKSSQDFCGFIIFKLKPF